MSNECPSATVIILPVMRIDDRIDDQQVHISVRMPSKVYRRLTDLADQWGLTPVASAEALLTEAINVKSGAKR